MRDQVDATTRRGRGRRRTSWRSCARTRELPSVALGASPRAAVHLLAASKASGPAQRPRLRHPRRRRRGWRARCCATAWCCAPRPSSSATGPTTRCRRRSRRSRSRGEPIDRWTPRSRRGRAGRSSPSSALAVAPWRHDRARARRRVRRSRRSLAGGRVVAARRASRPLRGRRDPGRTRPVVRHCRALSPRRGGSRTSTPSRSERGSLRLRQPLVPDVAVDPAEADGRLDARVVARRRGRHTLPARRRACGGPLGLAAWYRARRRAERGARVPGPAGGAAAGARGAAGALPRPGRGSRADRSGSAPTSSRSATTSPTTTSARSTGARPQRLGTAR